ncbi:hypothetical protein SRHO_G00059250 [Serrasalmus rhombeus]
MCMFYNACISKVPVVKILKFANDTTVVGFILLLNTQKTVEMVVGKPSLPTTLNINGSMGCTVEFLGTTKCKDLTWEKKWSPEAREHSQEYSS